MALSSVEMCAGAGGQALGLEMAGFGHEALVEIDPDCCNTLRLNRPQWNVFEQDLNSFDGRKFRGVDLLAGGLPCPPFSVAGKQLGSEDERNLFPAAFRLVDEIRPKAVMIENVRGFLSPVFSEYREIIRLQFERMGYKADWRLFNASDYGVPQLRPRVVIVAMRSGAFDHFQWEAIKKKKPKTVGDTLHDLMAANGWQGAAKWKALANNIAPTIVGGSKKHGGPDLGPTRARQAWAEIGVNASTVALEAPEKGFGGMPRLTVPMVARLQGFPNDWKFSGKKTAAYRQVGNAFPPPVAAAVAKEIFKVLNSAKKIRSVA